MRRLFGAALIGALVLGATACSADRNEAATSPTPAVGPGPAGASVPGVPGASGGTPAQSGAATGAGSQPNAGDAALAGDTKAICAQAARTSGTFGAQLVEDVKLLTEAEQASDPNALTQARQKAARDVQNFGYALKDLSQLAADPTVKKALADMSAQVSATKGDVTKLGGEKLDVLRGRLEKACGW